MQVKSNDTTDLTIAVMPTLDCLPFYVANESQIYKKLGLNVNFLSYRSLLKCCEVFGNGRIDGTFITLPQVLYMHSQGTALKIIMRTEGDVFIIANRTKRIKKVSSMRERLVAITRNNIGDYLCDDMADITKIPAFDILRPQINDLQIRKQMLENNQVDAVAMPEPYAGILRQEGHTTVFSTKNSNIKFGCIAVADTALRKKSEKIRLLLKGYMQAATAINKNRKIADSVLIKQFMIPAKMVDSIKIPVYSKLQSINAEDYNRADKWCIKRKLTKMSIPSYDILSSKFIKDE